MGLAQPGQIISGPMEDIRDIDKPEGWLVPVTTPKPSNHAALQSFRA
jgi:hypothetical protein